ncbi:MAG: tannase/feruloyl esterase family alpha/beta hydrolase [Asticcacaulis sp.]|nr:tannase/feruloyl esterase family alpha/beta hydrolase [Asticcacaulis sp.]
MLAIFFFAAGQAGAAAPDPADPAYCEGFQAKPLRFQDKSVRVLSSRFVAAGALPAHCEIVGTLQERKGRNGQQYAIRFHMRLPVAWNHRFVFQGGGGSNGELGDALGHLGGGLPPALAQNFAVISQDSGHDNATNSDPAFNGPLAFGFDPEARANYGHRSLKAVAQLGKEMLVHYYHEKPRYSYFVGCSKGGQEGMMFAQRYPDMFDGIIATAPGFSLPRAAVAEAWDVQVFGALVKRPGAATFDVTQLYKAFSAADLDLVRAAILDACDEDDGLRDGIVGDYLRCTDAKVVPRLRAKVCKADKADGCLSEAQIAALLRSRHGPRNAKGEQLYSDWAWPSGIAGEGWRMWKVGFADGRAPAFNVMLGAAALASVFTTPPTVLANEIQALANYQMAFDFDRDAARIYAIDAPFTHSAWDDIGARSPALAAFRKRGGRLIVPHGDSDPVFSLNDTLNWYREVDTRSGGAAASFVRVFPVPGMCHCGGGQATDDIDTFTALVKWVEASEAPAFLNAKAGPNSPWPGRERPVCAYPTVARYKGEGDPEKAASFACKI